MFTHLFIQAQIKVNIQAPRYWPFVRGIHRWPVNSPHKRPVTQKMFPFDDVTMIWLNLFIDRKTLAAVTCSDLIIYHKPTKMAKYQIRFGLYRSANLNYVKYRSTKIWSVMVFLLWNPLSETDSQTTRRQKCIVMSGTLMNITTVLYSGGCYITTYHPETHLQTWISFSYNTFLSCRKKFCTEHSNDTLVFLSN